MTTSLNPSIVRIRTADDTVVGAGFLVGQRQVLTCAHVIDDALSRPRNTPAMPQANIHLDFPLVAPNQRLTARVVCWQPAHPDGSGDVAGLELTGDPPAEASPVRLVKADKLWGHTFRAYGFPTSYDIGVWASGELRDVTTAGWLQIEGTQVTGYRVQPGFSGGPVWDEQLGGVVGMVTAAEEQPDIKAAFIIPTAILVEAWPELPFYEPLSKLSNVPLLPPHFLPRDQELAALRALLLSDSNDSVAITGRTLNVGLQGMGGIGKSVLAAALARDDDVRRAYPDGVLWVTLGQTPALTARQTQIADALEREPHAFTDVQQGRACLSELLADKHCLLILDDVWDAGHVRPFDALGPRCRMLLTSRDAGLIAALGATERRLDVLDAEQALRLLARWARLDIETLPPEANEVAEECGNLPLALAMVGAMVRGRSGHWANALHRLRSADLQKIRQGFPDYPYPDLLRAIQVSVQALEPDVQARYLDLAVFPEDTPIPQAALQTFWTPQGLDEFDVQDVLAQLVDRSLARRDEAGCLTLHDLQYDYVRQQTDDLPALHQRLLRAYAARCPAGWPSGPDDGYYFQHLAGHLMQAGRADELRELLLDFDWLQAKLEAADAADLSEDYELLPDDAELRLVQGAIRLSAHMLAQDKALLWSQLYGRLMAQDAPAIQAILARWPKTPWLRPLVPNLAPPGGPLLYTLTGHTDVVSAVAVTLDGRRAISASWDKTLKMWDLERGEELYTLTGHTTIVNAVAVTPDGRRAVSASRRMLKVWDLERGEVLHTLTGHTPFVMSVAVMPDGRRAVSASGDRTLKVWDLERGEELHTLTGHTDRVNTVAVTPNGRRAVSASGDRTLKVWDLERGEVLRTLTGRGGIVWAVAVTPDGRRAVSAGDGRTLQVWDLERGKVLHTLMGHRRVNAVAVTPDGRRAVSTSHDDRTLKVWDLERGKVLRTLTGHTSWANAVAVTPDGRRAVSTSSDRTLKVWDLRERGEELHTITGHTGEVEAVVVTPDGRRAVSTSRRMLKVWDLEQSEELRTLTSTRRVKAVAVTPDGRRTVSAGDGGMLKVWDLERGEELHTLTGHTGWVNAVVVTPDGRRAVSASHDQTLKVWDLERGEELRTLTGHTRWIKAVAVTPDGRRAVSASGDRTLKVWDLERGEELRTLMGHTDWVNTVAVTPDGRWAVSTSHDRTLKVWDLERGEELCTLTGYPQGGSAVAVTPDGQRAVSASHDWTLKVWNLERGEVLRTLTGHSGIVRAVAVTPDGRRAVSASHDRTLKVWDIGESGKLVAAFSGENAFTACAVALDGTIVAGDRLGRVHFLRLEGV